MRFKIFRLVEVTKRENSIDNDHFYSPLNMDFDDKQLEHGK